MSIERADVVVVGLGALGSAAAWQLARRGVDVIGLEQYELGHARGASHGDSRIIRLSYHTPSYVLAAQEAYADWARLEADCGQRLVTRCGGVDVFPPDAAIPFDAYADSMAAAQVPFEQLDTAAVRRRWPALAVPDGSRVLLQAQTGIVPADGATRQLRTQAAVRGARLRGHCRVQQMREVEDGVEVLPADGRPVRARTAILACDAWTNEPAGRAGHVAAAGGDQGACRALRGAAGGGPRALPGAFPVWIWMDDPSYYGFPCFGEASIKVGQDCGGRRIEPSGAEFESDVGPDAEPDAWYVQRMAQFLARLVPGAGPVSRVTTCRYTLTPDRDFVLGAVPGHERVLVALGAAHGFKFAPWFGRVLADLATTGTTSSQIAAFAPDRPALSATAPAEHWLV